MSKSYEEMSDCPTYKCPHCKEEIRTLQAVITLTFDVRRVDQKGRPVVKQQIEEQMKKLHCWGCEGPIKNFVIV